MATMVNPELEQERVNAWLLATLGEKLARHLEWIIEEPDSGLVPEVLAAIRKVAAEDVAQWTRGMQQAGFERPAAPSPRAAGEGAASEEEG